MACCCDDCGSSVVLREDDATRDAKLWHVAAGLGSVRSQINEQVQAVSAAWREFMAR